MCYLHFLSLDRTNFVQDILSRTTLEQYLSLVRREWLNSFQLWSQHRELWAESGDALSRIYAGTGALNTSYTRSGKRTLAGEYPFDAQFAFNNIDVVGLLSDATKSVSRAYINNFQDKGKQVAIDMFLVHFQRLKIFPQFSHFFSYQGTLSDQQPVTISDPIHDTVHEALSKRQAPKFL